MTWLTMTGKQVCPELVEGKEETQRSLWIFSEAVIHRSWVSVLTPPLTRPTFSQQWFDYNEMIQKDKNYFGRNFLS
jgi:hypothetical protein